MDDRTRTALVALRKILRATDLSSRTLVRQAGLTPSQLIVLQILARGRASAAREIARAATLSQATITALLDRLEAKGLVQRRRQERDRRQVSVEITSEGKHILSRAPDVLQNQFQERFARLQEWEQAMLIAALERVATLLNADAIDAAPILDVGEIDRPPEGEPGEGKSPPTGPQPALAQRLPRKRPRPRGGKGAR